MESYEQKRIRELKERFQLPNGLELQEKHIPVEQTIADFVREKERQDAKFRKTQLAFGSTDYRDSNGSGMKSANNIFGRNAR